MLTIKLGYDAGGMVEFLAETGTSVLPFAREHATARIARMPVLFIGDDFSRTDIPAA